MVPRRAAALPLLALVLALAAGAARSQDAPPDPPAELGRIVLDERIHDAGEVVQGTKVVHEFRVRNAGEGPLRIVAHPHCGCTLVDLDREIPPGGEGSIVVSLDTTRLEGAVLKDIDLHVNDPDSRELTLGMRAVVQPAMRLEPVKKVHLRGKVAGRSRPVTIHVSSVDGTAFDVLEVETRDGNPSVHVKAAPLVPAADAPPAADAGKAKAGDRQAPPARRKGRRARQEAATPAPAAPPAVASGANRYAITIDRDPAWRAGASAARVILHTSHSHGKIVEIPVTAKLEGSVRVSPEKLLFGSFSPTGQEVGAAADERFVRVSQPGSAAFRVLDARSTDPHFTVRVVPVVEGSEYDVVVRYVPGPQPARLLQAQVVVDTTDDTQPQVTIDVVAVP